jgi:hypothetical protein
MTTLLLYLVKSSYTFRRTKAIIRELIRTSQATYMSVCITRRVMEFRVHSPQSVLLRCGYKWLGLTAVWRSGLSWDTAQCLHRAPCSTTVHFFELQLATPTSIHSVTILTGANGLETPLINLLVMHIDILGQTIKFANSPPCDCQDSTGQKA